MMAKEYEDLKVYDLSSPQGVQELVLKYSLFKGITNMPACIFIKQALDWNLMQKAYDIEIQRNDSMRLRLFKTKNGIKQSFLPEMNSRKVEFKDFSGSTDEEMMAWLNERAGRKLNLFKDETYEMIFFKTPNGESGIYFCVTHLVMDVYAILLTLKDMMDVYEALRKGNEMPEPLTRFEDSLQRDLAYSGSEREEKDRVFFDEYWQNKPLLTYCGVDGGRELENNRKKKKEPNYRAVNSLALIKNKIRTTTFHVEQKTIDRWMEFLDIQKINFQTLMHLGLHLALSASNDCEEGLCTTFATHRRVKKDDLRCGGVRALALQVPTIFPKDTKVLDALKEIGKDLLKLLRHSDLTNIDVGEIRFKYQGLQGIADNNSLVYSVFPPGSVLLSEGYDFDFQILNGIRSFSWTYLFMYPNLKEGGMNYGYRMYVSRFTEEDVQRFHNLFVKGIEAVIANSEGTIGDMYDEMLR